MFLFVVFEDDGFDGGIAFDEDSFTKSAAHLNMSEKINCHLSRREAWFRVVMVLVFVKKEESEG